MRMDLLRQREETAAQLDDGTAALFRKVSNRMKGAVVAAVDESGRCTSCNIQIRPQAYNEIVGAKAVHTCGSCGKILVLRAAPTAAPEAATR
jgi:predicted  nucleic acid-binding Zn-ribbon protein